MDSSAKKAFELQTQIRRQSKLFQQSLGDMHNWQKEIKDREKFMKTHADKEEYHMPQVRSHITEKQEEQPQTSSMKKGKPDTSEDGNATYSGAVGLKQQHANEIKDRGNNYVKKGNYEQAIEEYNAAIELCPRDAVFYTNRALCYLKLKRHEECIEDCERAIMIDKNAIKAYYRRMLANEYLGNDLDALKDCTTVLMLDSKNPEAKKSLDRINNKIKQNSKDLKGAQFSPMTDDMVDILTFDKPPYRRSKKPLIQIPVTDIVGPKDTKNYENSNLKISDEDIEKLFNSNCGPFVEVKKELPKPEITMNTQQKDDTVKFISEKRQELELQAKEADLNKPVAKTEQLPNLEIKGSDKSPIEKNESLPSPKLAEDIGNNSKSATPIQPLSMKPLPPPPTATAQFYANWKELSHLEKYQYFKSIDIALLRKLLGAGLDSDTLADILNIMHDYYLPQNESTIAQALLEVSKNNQIGILSLLMSSKDRQVLMELLDVIKSSSTASAELIAKNFNLY